MKKEYQQLLFRLVLLEYAPSDRTGRKQQTTCSRRT